MWYKFLSEYLKEWHRVSLVHKRGSVKNISTATGLAGKQCDNGQISFLKVFIGFVPLPITISLLMIFYPD